MRDHPACATRTYEPDEIEFMKAIEEWKKANGRLFPTWSEVLQILKSLDYRKVPAPKETRSPEDG